MFKNNLTVLLIFFTRLAHAHVEQLGTIEVTETKDFELPLSRVERASVVKKEKLTKERVEHKNAVSLAKAIDLEPGVQTTLTCANCGSQRVTLNGMRGENTTILVDGIPAYSSVSSFYGMEAIPMSGVAAIEIMRGAGSSLTAPEAIGGVVNLVTERTDQNKFSYLVRGGERESFNQQFLGVYGTAKRGTLITAQTNQMSFFDEDNNSVAEASAQNQKAVFIKHDHKLTERLKVSVRGGHQDLELIGGATEHFRSKSYPTTLADETSFEDGDVRKKFVGSLDQISDWIRLKRMDGGGSFLYHFDGETNIKGSFSLAKQEQFSVYSHGYDYDNEDMFRFFDLKVNRLIGEDHLLTIGVDHRNEEMNSSSKFLYLVNDFYRDSFTFDTLGVYIQNEWFISDKDELNLVLRIDTMDVKWQDQRISDNHLKKSVLAPRVHYKRSHTDTLSSRFSFGVGYRAPLTLFESQHGTNEEGFEIEINELERAETFTYTLNYDQASRSSAFSATLTQLHNMAYGDENEQPIKFRNASQTMAVGTLNLLHIEKITINWTVESTFDWFMMPDSYKDKLPIAAQETRARFISDYHFGKNEFVTTLNVVGRRNLKPYNYDKNYNVLSEDPITFEDVPSSQKNQTAPLFYTIDLFLQRKVTDRFRLLAGVTNLLDYTQTKDKESPLSWRIHGDHVHLDNRHIWGPVQGRVIYAGLNYQL